MGRKESQSMTKEKSFYYEQRTQGSGLPMDDLKQWLEEHKKELQRERDAKKTAKRRKERQL